MTEIQRFPSYRYHRTEPPIIVMSPEEDATLNPEEWKQSPAHFDTPEQPADPPAPIKPRRR